MLGAILPALLARCTTMSAISDSNRGKRELNCDTQSRQTSRLLAFRSFLDAGVVLANVAALGIGGIWALLAERQHPDIPRSKYRDWLLGPDGSVRHEVPLGDFHLFAIACVPQTGDAWAAGLGSGLLRISAAGEAGKAMSMRAYSVAVGRESGDIWVANDEEVLKLDRTGQLLLRSAHPKPSNESFLMAF